LTFPGPRPLFCKDSTKNAILRSERAVYPVFCLILPLSSSGPVTRGGVKGSARNGVAAARRRHENGIEPRSAGMRPHMLPRPAKPDPQSSIAV